MKKVVSKTVGVILLALSLTTMSANAQTNNSKEVEVVTKCSKHSGQVIWKL